MTELTTTRLRLRHWLPEDLAPFAELNADPLAMRLMRGRLTQGESQEFARRAQAYLADRGWGMWAVASRDDGTFLGSVGLNCPGFTTHFTPCVEVAWRFLPRHWGSGYATEAARASLDYAFGVLELSEVVAFTVPHNTASRRVMERLRMTHHERDDLDHPRIPPGDALSRHVLYRVRRADWACAET
jgi:RimJ/RimL family protein N-acetyltransferase